MHFLFPAAVIVLVPVHWLFYYFPSSSSSFLLFSLLVLLLIFSVFPPPPRPHFYCFYLLNRPAERGKLKFQKSTTCIFWPQKFSFKLPIVLKTDFERRDNALEIDFGLWSLPFFHRTETFKILKIMKNLQNITFSFKLSKSPLEMCAIMYSCE